MSSRSDAPRPASRRLTRRVLLRAGAVAAATGAVAVPAAMLGLFNGNSDSSQPEPAGNGVPGEPGGYGPAKPAPDLSDGVRRLAVPEGFSYRSFGVAGTRMSDGNPTPIGHDGMAAFLLPNGNIRLIRNHEDYNDPRQGSVGGSDGTKYDVLAGGGTTSLEVNPRTRELIRDFISLNGTYGNCAGGHTPWGTWLTCEETYEGPPKWTKPHGYIFEVSAASTAPVLPVPLTQMGRFVHEGAAVDPATSIVYETEDNGEASGFYRYIPKTPGRLIDGGRLQMLAVRDKPMYDTRTGQHAGEPLPVEWIDIPDPDPVDGNPIAVWASGFLRGGARFMRLEGCYFAGGSVFLCATVGGDAGLGQVWQYDTSGAGGERLSLLYESKDAAVLKQPDNICVSPRGGLVISEDGPTPIRLKGLTRKGELFALAENLLNDSEWAGPTFSPDGETLFVNLQGPNSGPNPPAANPGRSFAIWGPWARGAL